MSSFFSLKVIELVQETKDCVSVSFEIPSSLKDRFLFLAGQYLTLKLSIDGEEVRRSYSICSSPEDNTKITVAVKRVKGGKASNFINEKIKIGDVLEVMSPMGNFHSAMHASNRKKYYLFAGGSGITPMMSIIKSVLHFEKDSSLVLFYGNENEEAIIFNDQLNEIEKSADGRLKVFNILNHPQNEIKSEMVGIMDVMKNKELIASYVDLKSDNEYFICGPVGMMDIVVSALKDASATQSRVHVEYFTAPVSEDKSDSGEGVNARLTIICDGDKRVIDLKSAETVLDAALAAGIDAPYACQGGSCCTCRAKLLSGKVHMKVNYALLDSEVKEGFILTCQAVALSNELVVDYDKGR